MFSSWGEAFRQAMDSFTPFLLYSKEVMMTYIKRGNRITLEMTQEEFDDVLEDAVKGATSRCDDKRATRWFLLQAQGHGYTPAKPVPADKPKPFLVHR